MTDSFIQEFNPPQSDVAICGSMAHKAQWLQVIDMLLAEGLTVTTPDLSETSDWSQFSEAEIVTRKGWLMRRHIANIAKSHVVLVCNYDKKGIKNYIGSNTFLEMGAAFVLGKPIYVLNDIPQQDNREELLALQPISLGGDVSQLIDEVKA